MTDPRSSSVARAGLAAAPQASEPAAHTYAIVGTLLALGGVMLFSLRPIFIKLAYAHVVDPVTLLALRMAFSLPFFVAIAFWLRRQAPGVPISRSDWWQILFLGFLAYYLASFLDFLGLQYISAGLGRLIMFLYPTIVVLLSWVVLRKPAGQRELTAVAISYAGLVLVFWKQVGAEHLHLILGAALVFAAATSYAIYLVVGSEVIRRVGTMRFTAYSMIVASLLCIVQFGLLRPIAALDLPAPVYGYAVAMAIGSTVIPIFMTSEALKRIGANRFAIVGSLGPVVTIVLGWLGLEEALSPLQIAGAALIIAGVMAVSLKPARR